MPYNGQLAQSTDTQIALGYSMGMFDPIVDWVVYGLTAFSSAVFGWGIRVESHLGTHDDRIGDIERRLEGDEADPSSPGALRTIHNLDEKVDELEEQIEENRQERKEEHRTVLDKLEELVDDE